MVFSNLINGTTASPAHQKAKRLKIQWVHEQSRFSWRNFE